VEIHQDLKTISKIIK